MRRPAPSCAPAGMVGFVVLYFPGLLVWYLLFWFIVLYSFNLSTFVHTYFFYFCTGLLFVITFSSFVFIITLQLLYKTLILGTTGATCDMDINECEEQPGVCGDNAARCLNTHARYVDHLPFWHFLLHPELKNFRFTNRILRRSVPHILCT